MSSTDLVVRPEPSDTGADDIIHVACCITGGIALCGTRVDTLVADDGRWHDCVVCEDLAYAAHCPAGHTCPPPETT